ncbi:aldo/keto reductase [Mariniluteicoccus endophyticus]
MTTLAPGLTTSAIGFGCMALSHVYGCGTSDDEARRTLADSLAAGITFLDTADIYGEPRPGETGPAGTNEEMLAPFLAQHRDEVQLATKFGIATSFGREPADGRATNGDPAYVQSACEASLRRLGVETIDLYYQHRPDPTVPLEDTIGAMAALVEQGKVRHLGLSEVTADELRRAHAIHPIAAVQSEWSVWSRDVEANVVPACAELGVGFVPYSPLGRGFLTGTLTREQVAADARGRMSRIGEGWDANQAALAVVAEVAERVGATNAQVVLAWLLAKGRAFGLPVVPIPGSKRAERMSENLAAAELELDEAAVARLDQITDLVHGDRNIATDPRWISSGRE